MCKLSVTMSKNKIAKYKSTPFQKQNLLQFSLNVKVQYGSTLNTIRNIVNLFTEINIDIQELIYVIMLYQ